MNAAQSIEYFSSLDWRLWRAPGHSRGRWLLAPRSKQHQPKDFASLTSAWAWWRLQICRAMLLERSFERAVHLCRTDASTHANIRRWALSEGIIELPEDVQFEIDLPYLVISHNERQSIRQAHRLAADAWTVSSADVFQRVLQWMQDEERKSLISATAPAAAPRGCFEGSKRLI